jgi:hypothetical protein
MTVPDFPGDDPATQRDSFAIHPDQAVEKRHGNVQPVAANGRSWFARDPTLG